MTASIGDGANDGDPGENDEVGADVERLRGGSGGDTLTGDLNRNVLIGGPGADSLFGLAGDDVLRADDGVADTELDCGDGSGDRLESDAGLDPAGIGCER